MTRAPLKRYYKGSTRAPLKRCYKGSIRVTRRVQKGGALIICSRVDFGRFHGVEALGVQGEGLGVWLRFRVVSGFRTGFWDVPGYLLKDTFAGIGKSDGEALQS